eukprot:6475468-Amphidinium_carterae.1
MDAESGQSFVRVVGLTSPSESRSCEEYEDAGHMQKAGASEAALKKICETTKSKLLSNCLSTICG